MDIKREPCTEKFRTSYGKKLPDYGCLLWASEFCKYGHSNHIPLFEDLPVLGSRPRILPHCLIYFSQQPPKVDNVSIRNYCLEWLSYSPKITDLATIRTGMHLCLVGSRKCLPLCNSVPSIKGSGWTSWPLKFCS